MDVYSSALAQYQQAAQKYRGKLEAGVGQAKTVVEVAGGAYGAARLSAHLGGPAGKKIAGLPIELWIAGGAAAASMSGHAGRHAEDLLAVGIGALSAYTARKGFEAGLATARPADAGGGAVQGVGCAPQLGAGSEIGASALDEAARTLGALRG